MVRQKVAHSFFPKTPRSRETLLRDAYEPEILRVVDSLVKSSDTCFDIGGHYGYYTLCLSSFAKQGSVHTFEPVDAHAERIRQSVDKSAKTNVTVHQTAVADRIGEAVLHIASETGSDDSMAYLEECGGVDTAAAREHYSSFTPTTVPTTTLDELATTLPHPQFIKIDAEGAEAAIIKAGRKLISAAKPRILIETHGIHEGLACAALFNTINYRAVLIRNQETTMPVLWIERE